MLDHAFLGTHYFGESTEYLAYDDPIINELLKVTGDYFTLTRGLIGDITYYYGMDDDSYRLPSGCFLIFHLPRDYPIPRRTIESRVTSLFYSFGAPEAPYSVMPGFDEEYAPVMTPEQFDAMREYLYEERQSCKYVGMDCSQTKAGDGCRGR